VAAANKHLLIASMEACSGKSAILLGLADKLQQQGVEISYSKPLGNYYENGQGQEEADVGLMRQWLGLSASQVFMPLVGLTAEAQRQRLVGADTEDYQALLRQQVAVPDRLLCIEGGSNLWEGRSFNLSTAQIAEVADATVLLVMRYQSIQSIERLLAAQDLLGDRLLGVVINDVPPAEMALVSQEISPALEKQGIAVLGVLPQNRTLRSVSVGELVKRLQAEVLCCPERLDLLVESLSIGAMNVSAALDYFRKARCMAVVTGGDREDIQLAALETSTQCLILTGHLSPQSYIIRRAEDLEIPIVSVNFDTLTTVEIVEDAFARIRIQEPVKVAIIRQLMAEHFQFDRFAKLLQAQQ
jgi:uncharacterized protein